MLQWVGMGCPSHHNVSFSVQKYKCRGCSASATCIFSRAPMLCSTRKCNDLDIALVNLSKIQLVQKKVPTQGKGVRNDWANRTSKIGDK